jgi:hypothetical protein
MNFSDLLKMYRSEVDRLEALTARYKADEKEAKERLTKLSSVIKTEADKVGLEMIKSDYGTMTWKHSRSVTISDGEAFFNYVKANDRFDLLQKRVTSAVALEIIDSGEVLPGTAIYAEIKPSFRRV